MFGDFFIIGGVGAICSSFPVAAVLEWSPLCEASLILLLLLSICVKSQLVKGIYQHGEVDERRGTNQKKEEGHPVAKAQWQEPPKTKQNGQSNGCSGTSQDKKATEESLKA